MCLVSQATSVLLRHPCWDGRFRLFFGPSGRATDKRLNEWDHVLKRENSVLDVFASSNHHRTRGETSRCYIITILLFVFVSFCWRTRCGNQASIRTRRRTEQINRTTRERPFVVVRVTVVPIAHDSLQESISYRCNYLSAIPARSKVRVNRRDNRKLRSRVRSRTNRHCKTVLSLSAICSMFSTVAFRDREPVDTNLHANTVSSFSLQPIALIFVNFGWKIRMCADGRAVFTNHGDACPEPK